MHNPHSNTTNQQHWYNLTWVREYFSKQIKEYKCRLLSPSKVSPSKVSNLPPSQIVEEDERNKIQQDIEDIKNNIDELKHSVSKRTWRHNAGFQQSGSTLCSDPSLIGPVHRQPITSHKPLVSERRITPEERSIEPSWKAPDYHGLENSPRIIPEYYTSTNLKNGILKIDYYDMIIDDIRNLRPLSLYQMKYIRKKLTPQEYYNIIHEYNKVMYFYIDVYLQT